MPWHPRCRPWRDALAEVETQHAQLDLDQLMTMGKTWSHPTQALPRPIAPYGALLRVCARRLEAADEGAHEHLRYMYERLRLAYELSETARIRRIAMALGIPWTDDETHRNEAAHSDDETHNVELPTLQAMFETM